MSTLLQALPRYPSLLQINTRVWITELSRALGRRATLDDLPDAELDRLAATGFDWIWLLSAWQTGAAGRQVSRGNPQWRKEFQETLLDLCEEDIAGSGFAITGYAVHTQLGGDEALARLRERLRRRGLRLLLDFVPNHTGLDHPWVETHPEYYVQGTELDLARAPVNYTWIKRKQGDRLLAYGRDPYFPGWPDAPQHERKNFLFVGSDRGGRTAAMVYSFVASCKRLGGDPYAYLRDILERLPTHLDDRLAELLPGVWLSPHPHARLKVAS
jgi:hypothetical protein